MYNIFIYGGLGILLLAALVALVAAIKGFILSNRKQNPVETKKAVSKLTKPALIITILGFVIIGIGIILSIL